MLFVHAYYHLIRQTEIRVGIDFSRLIFMKDAKVISFISNQKYTFNFNSNLNFFIFDPLEFPIPIWNPWMPKVFTVEVIHLD